MPSRSVMSTLWDPIDYCSPPGSSAHELLQARILEWVATPFSRGSSWPSGWVHISFVPYIGRQVLYHQYHLRSPEIQYARNQILRFPPSQAMSPPTPSHSHGLEAGLRNEGVRGGFQRKFRCFNSKNRKELSRKSLPPHLKDRCGMGVGDGERAGKTQSDYHSSLKWALWNALWGHLEAAWWAGFPRRSFRETRDSRGSLWNN